MGDDDDKIRLNQRKPSKYKGLSRFGPEKNLQRINKFMKERPTFYKNLIQMKENIPLLSEMLLLYHESGDITI